MNRWSLAAPAGVWLVAGGLGLRFARGWGTGPEGRRPGEAGSLGPASSSEAPPAGFAGLSAFATKAWALGLAAAGLMAPALVLDTGRARGASLDWDNVAVAAMPLLALAGLLWSGPAARSRAVRGALAAAIALGVFGTASFVVVNARPGTAIERFAALSQAPEWTGRTRGMAAETLAGYLRDTGRFPEAADWYVRAAEADSTNYRMVRNAAAAEARAGRHRRSVGFYLRASRFGPPDPSLWYRLGIELEALGSADSAAVAYRESLRLEPRSVDALNRLARLLLLDDGPRDDVEAVRLLRRSLELRPDQPGAAEVRSLLNRLQSRGR